MSNTPQVVEGEASESDSEYEIEIAKSTGGETPQGSNIIAVISGEASESEDEGKRSPPLKRDTSLPPSDTSPSHFKMCRNSILHQRLWEVNVSMRTNIEILSLHTMRIAYERMASLTKDLLNLQESVRVADNQVTLARARSRQVQEQLKNCHFQTALPTVKIE